MKSMSRRQLLATAAKAGLATTITATLARSLGPWVGMAGSTSTRTRCLWGAYVRDGIESVEDEIGRRYDIEHIYRGWDEPLLPAAARESVEQGRRLLINWRASRRNGGAVRWADIAAGKQDAVIRARADELKGFAAPGRPKVALAFHHEPENDRDESVTSSPNGSIDDFRAAFRRVHGVMTDRGVRNVRWTLILFASTYRNELVKRYYPGDDVVDIVGADGYNWFGAKPNAKWKSFEQIFRAHHEFAVEHAKSAWVCEFGSLEDPDDPDRKAQWFLDMAEVVNAWPRMKAVVYFQGGEWGWDVASSSPALAAYSQVGNSPPFS